MSAILTLSNVGKKYGSRTILQGFNLTLGEGGESCDYWPVWLRKEHITEYYRAIGKPQ